MLFSTDPTAKTDRSKKCRCDDVLSPEMPFLLLQLVLNLGAQSLTVGVAAVQREES